MSSLNPEPSALPATAVGPAASVGPAEIRIRDGKNGAVLGATFYEQVGGRVFFEKLVHKFYEGVATDALLKPMYPEDDLGPAEKRLSMFLEQYWGGPGTYSEQRGHPRLRQRHQGFKVSPKARDRWLFHMRAAVDFCDLPPLQRETLWDYLDRAAQSLLNTFDD